MIKRIAIALALAVAMSATMSVGSPSAEAGPFRDKLKRAAEKVVLKGLCVTDRLSGLKGKTLFCK